MTSSQVTSLHPLDQVSITFPHGVYADVRLERTAEHRISLKDGEIEDVQSRVETGALLRVLKAGRWYTAATTELDQIDEMLAELAASGALQPLDGFTPDAQLQVHVETIHAFDDERIEHVSVEEKLALLRGHLPSFERDEVRTHSALWIDQHRDRRFVSSKGADVRHDYQEAGIILTFTMASEGQTLTERFFEADHRFSALEADMSGRLARLETYLDRCARFVAEAVPIEPGEYPVVLAPSVAGVFAHESFGHKSEADFMLGDPSMLEDWQIGMKVGSSLLSIVDTGTEWGSGYMAFDDEGQKAGKTYLIKDGILSGRLHASHTAEALGEVPTGNARAISFRFEPIVRMTTTYIEPGTSSVDALIAGISDGFFLETIVHGSGMSTFTLAPGLAWRIRNGALAEPARVAVVTGTVFETLGEIDGLSEAFDMPFRVGGGCGKLEQWPLSVGIGGPYVRVRRMNLA